MIVLLCRHGAPAYFYALSPSSWLLHTVYREDSFLLFGETLLVSPNFLSIDAGYERLMYAGEMLGKMSRAGSDDEEKEGDDEEDDEDDQAKKKPSE